MTKIIQIPTIAVIFLLYIQNALGTTYGFFHSVSKPFPGTRRVFGGDEVGIEEYPEACLLTDKHMKSMCTGTIIALHHVLTAAHCITPKLRYVMYNTRSLREKRDVAEITRVFRHPRFSYTIRNEGSGPDVVMLQHDVGLIETDELLTFIYPKNGLVVPRIARTGATNLLDSDVTILGFGATSNRNSPELIKVSLRTQRCARRTWIFCACGKPKLGQRSGGVCTGDSGGPVLFNNHLVGVTSMGPTDCSKSAGPQQDASSVFTLVSLYADMINNTINDNQHTNERMREVPLHRLSRANSFHDMVRYHTTFIILYLLMILLQ
ncbi:hypothetical protein O0L34_g4752 [Tuta absoluta]|nr:hypothetical protein O0L34_g4752 [Tuta absoluta]